MKSELLSFCIPNYNRFEHIQKTLATNLADNLEDKDDVEFILVDFTGECERWITEKFPNELNCGYLKYLKRDLGRAWHFGRAKGCFKEIITSTIYSSLDGDNYTGYRGGKHIIDVFKEYDFQCIFHQFSGVWKDGSCGRISLPVNVYKAFSYDPLFFPRGYDEIDCVLSVLKGNPSLFYVHYAGIQNALRQCPLTSQFITENNFQVKEKTVHKNIIIKDPEFSKVNILETPQDRFFHRCNMLMSFLKNTEAGTLKADYEAQISEQQIAIKYCRGVDLLDTILWRITPGEPNISTDDIILCCVLKDAGFYLGAFLKHYRKLGVTKFFFIDNNSNPPLSLDGEDVFVWQTKVGYFKYFKVFWIDLLLTRYAKNNWCLTVDIDEFLVYEGCENKSLKEFVSQMKEQSFLPSVLLDVYSKDYTKDTCEVFRENCIYCDQWEGSDPEYYEFPACKWAYGKSAKWFRKFDVRRRVFGTIDCLRKIPLFRYSKKLSFNQGFHDLLTEGKWSWIPHDLSLFLHPKRYLRLYRESKLKKESIVDSEIFGDSQKIFGILLHYKFVSCVTEQLQVARDSKQYFERTTRNQDTMLKKVADVNSFYIDGVSVRINDSKSLFSRVINEKILD